MEYIKKEVKGFTLIELMVSITIITVLIFGLYNLIILSIKISTENKAYVEATEIANQKMEQIRNLPYDQVGVLLGSPPGSIPQVEYVEREGRYKINTYIKFEDDPYDGLIGSTTNPDENNCGLDYKIATVIVSWQGEYGDKKISMFTKIIPNSMETMDGYGIMKILVNDKDGIPVPNALVSIYNNTGTTTIDVKNIPTNTEGILLYAVPYGPNYELSVTKIGYGTSTTYAASSTNPTPTPEHWTVAEGQLTEDNIEINKLVNINLNTLAQDLPDNFLLSSGLKPRNQERPSVALASDNSMYLTWESSTATSSFVYVQKYDFSLNSQWVSTIAINSTSDFQYKPDIDTLSSGNSYIVWHDNSSSLKLVSLPKKMTKQKTIVIKSKNNNSIKNIFSYLPNFNSIFNHRKQFINIIKNQKLKNIFFPLETKAASSIVQTKISSHYKWSSSMSTTFNTPPTEGNVIIAIAVLSNNSASFSAPYNSSGSFTESSYSATSYRPEVGMWHKIVGSSEPSQVNISANARMNGGVLILLEVSGLDTSNLLQTSSKNNQTSSTGLTANTGSTAMSNSSGFAIAASVFGDNNFGTSNSSDWSSISPDSWSQIIWDDWGPGNDDSIAIATLNITSASTQQASLTLSGAGAEERNSVIAVFNLSTPEITTVSSLGSQTASTSVAVNDFKIGGSFVITKQGSVGNINDISIKETGTVDALNYLSNIKLFYDLDTTSPYDCSSESYGGTESQFGATLTSFDSADGQADFSDAGGVNISETQSLCLYTILDISSDINPNDTLDIEINNPPSDINIDIGVISPSATVSINGSTELLTPAEIKQTHYRFRNDDGNEINASWKENEDTPVTIPAGEQFRLRFLVNNIGNLSSGDINYQIEYTQKTSSCSTIADANWEVMPNDNTKHWRIESSAFLTEEGATTNVSPGITDAGTFIAGVVKNTSNQTSAINLEENDFTEIEYSINSTANVLNDTYCFRLTNAGSSDFNYIEYPEITVVGDNNIFINSVSSTGILGSTKRVNADSSNANQINPKIKIKENGSYSTTTVIWEDDRNGNYDIYAQTLDGSNNRLWASDLQITSSSSNEQYADLTISSSSQIIIVWVENYSSKSTIYAQKIDFDGNLLWSSAKNLVDSLNDEYYPSLTIDESDNFYLTWTEKSSGIYNIYIAKYDLNGNKIWKTQANIDNLLKDQFHSDIEIYDDELLISWTDNNNSNNDIYSQKLDLDGNIIWTKDQRISIENSTHNQNYSQVIINSSKEYFSFWEDERDGNSEIYAAKFENPGVITSSPNVGLDISWTKEIGISTYENLNKNITTNSSGLANISLEYAPDGYTIEPTDATKTIILRNPSDNPLIAEPGDTIILELTIE